MSPGLRRPVCLLLACTGVLAGAQQPELPAPAVSDPQQLAPAIPDLARKVLAGYQEADPEKRLGNLFHLQMAAGDHSGALASLHALRALQQGRDPIHGGVACVPFELLAVARLKEASGQPFAAAFQSAFRERVGRMDDLEAVAAAGAFRFNPDRERKELQQLLDAQKGRTSLSPDVALELVRRYQILDAGGRILPLADALWADDDQRRFEIQDDFLIRTPDGASVSATVVRPRHAGHPVPAVLNFTIYTYPRKLAEAKESAAHGFAAVVAYTRGKRSSPDSTVPYEHDGADAAAVIDWISRQAWSDGQVAMYGGSYEGFTQWAAAKHLPPALKAIMPSVPVGPGIDFPMEGNVFENFPYKWIPYVTNTKGLDEADYNDPRWNGLDWSWFNSGKPYRDLEQLDGRPNPLFRRWLDHPAYDAYWQAMVPYGGEFSRITIPVLITTGYYDGCSISALYYLEQLKKHNPAADAYLVIGPYDHIGGQHQSQDVLLGYTIDPVARMDFHALRYQWMDHVLRGGPLPPLLKDRVNYEVMGANAWKHAPTIEGMSNGALKLYLNPIKAGDALLLSEAPPPKDASLRLRVDMADRNVLSFHQPMLIPSKTLDADNGFAFLSEPLKAPLEVSGLFSGSLEFITNKRDLDLNLQLFELTPKGEYIFLSYFLGRASYIQDRSHRHLLTPGRAQTLAFRSGRLTSRRLEAGSRIAVVLCVSKQPRLQVNYGTGKDVSGESSADAKAPLELTWRPGSFITLPVWR